MSKARIETILKYIDDIDYIVSTYGSVVSTLEDRIGKHSLLMCLMQIGENLNKLNSSNEEIIKASQGSYAVRNFIAHDYEGVNLALIENIVRNLLKPLKTELEKELIEIDLKNGDFQVQSAKEHIDDIKKEL
jgi:uncharacterized protein with HEPN domain